MHSLNVVNQYQLAMDWHCCALNILAHVEY